MHARGSDVNSGSESLMSETPRSEKTVFLEAVELSSPTERLEYLDRVCKDDAPLRARVDALLRASDEPRPLLDTPETVRKIIEGSTALECPGVMVGPYRLVEQLGEGGMGLVFVAEQMQQIGRASCRERG